MRRFVDIAGCAALLQGRRFLLGGPVFRGGVVGCAVLLQTRRLLLKGCAICNTQEVHLQVTSAK